MQIKFMKGVNVSNMKSILADLITPRRYVFAFRLIMLKWTITKQNRLFAVRFSIEVALERSMLDARLGREKREGLGRDGSAREKKRIFSSCPLPLSENALAWDYLTDLKRKGGLQAV